MYPSTGMKTFQAIDFIVVVAYLLTIAAFGSSFYRRRSTAQEYFLGGRTMWWLPAGISIVAADLSAITVMGTPAWMSAFARRIRPNKRFA